jgi:hypothetical protein
MRELPRMLRDILEHQFAEAPDIVLLPGEDDADNGTDWGDTDDWDDFAGRTPPDVVLTVSRSADGIDRIAQLLRCWPRTRVVAIEDNGRQVSLHESGSRRTDLGELSSSALLDAIRMVIKRDPIHG